MPNPLSHTTQGTEAIFLLWRREKTHWSNDCWELYLREMLFIKSWFEIAVQIREHSARHRAGTQQCLELLSISNMGCPAEPRKALVVAEEQLPCLWTSSTCWSPKELQDPIFTKVGAPSIAPKLYRAWSDVPQKHTTSKQDETGVITCNNNVLYLYKAL